MSSLSAIRHDVLQALAGVLLALEGNIALDVLAGQSTKGLTRTESSVQKIRHGRVTLSQSGQRKPPDLDKFQMIPVTQLREAVGRA